MPTFKLLRNFGIIAGLLAFTSLSASALDPESSSVPSPTPTPSASPENPALDENSEQPDFSPKLIWNNSTTSLLFPIQWMAASQQGTLLLGSMFSKSFQAYNIYTGECKGRQNLLAPTNCPPLIDGNSAIISDTTTALISFDSDTCQENWERLPLQGPRQRNDLRQPLPRPRINKVQPLMYDGKIVTMNTDGVVIFYPNKAPSTGSIPDFLVLQTSPDERGTFSITPTINRQIFYACTTSGHLHYVNLANISEVGIVKNRPSKPESSIAREVRVPLLASSRYIYMTTMDGTIHCYRAFRKFAGSKSFTPPTLVWSKKLKSKHRYQSNRWGRPVAMPILDGFQSTIYVAAKDGVQALEAETGETLWEHRIPQGVAYAPMIWSKYLLVITEPKGKIPAKIVALDPNDGHTLAYHELPGTPTSNPLLWNDYLILGYHNGYAECYQLANLTHSRKH